jgi:peptide/nickel transport system permease protein
MTLTLPTVTVFKTQRRQAFSRVSWLDRIVFVVVGLVLLTAVFGPLVAPDSVYHSDILNALAHPSSAYWFGTDEQGRDVLWRVVEGARYSVLSAVLVVTGFSVIGMAVASLATLGGRWVDETVMRATDAALAIPPIIFALGLAAALGPSLHSAIIAMIATGWPFTARLLRSVMRETMEMPFVEGARVLGVSRTRLMLRHVLPNSLDVLIVKWAGDIGNTIVILGALSFVGVGAQPPSAEWGAMVTGSKDNISTAWWAALAPGIAIAITATAFALLGDALQVRLNPEIRER